MAASIVSAYDAPAAESALESQDPTPDLAQPRRTEVAPPPPSRWRARFPSLVAGYGLGVVTSGVLVSIAFPVWPQPSAPVAALTPPVATAPPVAQMEGAGFALAALRLQIAIASSRPWRREYDALVAMAPPGAIPQPIASLLGVHAIRGVPNEVELRERFIELAPQLPKRLVGGPSSIDRLVQRAQSLGASIGLTDAGMEERGVLSITTIESQIRRGNLRGALSDSDNLDPAIRPYLAAWLADLQARVAVEEAVAELVTISVEGRK
jgi:hypothetical protein